MNYSPGYLPVSGRTRGAPESALDSADIVHEKVLLPLSEFIHSSFESILHSCRDHLLTRSIPSCLSNYLIHSLTCIDWIKPRASLGAQAETFATISYTLEPHYNTDFAVHKKSVYSQNSVIIRVLHIGTISNGSQASTVL